MREIDKDLIFINMNFENKSELFGFIADELKKRNYVTDTYEEAVNKREEKFPTGFQLKNINIAMPHADPVNSRADKLVVLTLEKPVEFQNAEDKGMIGVNIVFGLVFHNRDKPCRPPSGASCRCLSREQNRTKENDVQSW